MVTTKSIETGPTARQGVADYFFERMEDRTNVDAVMARFIGTAYEGKWVDEDGNPAEPASIEECSAIVNNTLRDMYDKATSEQSFLINVAALAGAATLMSKTTAARCTRLRGDENHHRYTFSWEYQLGNVRGRFAMPSSLPRRMWRGPQQQDHPDNKGSMTTMTEEANGGGGGGEGLSAGEWQRKYQALMGEMEKRDRELLGLKSRVMKLLKHDLNVT